MHVGKRIHSFPREFRSEERGQGSKPRAVNRETRTIKERKGTRGLRHQERKKQQMRDQTNEPTETKEWRPILRPRPRLKIPK
jgi:hypothetical protein